MEWLVRMNKAMQYIEDHLDRDIDYGVAAELACCSVYHFQRMFSFMVEVPLSEYIRRRRLTLAAFELQQSSIKVVDLALKYGYDSPEAFARAFQNLHKVSPTQARRKGIVLKSYPRLTFQISIRGVEEMNYRIEEKPAFAVFGVEETFSMENGANLVGIPQMWNRLLGDGTVERIGQDSGRTWNADSSGIMPVNAVMCYGEEEGETTFPYMICGFMPESGLPEGHDYTEVNIPALTWAIFTTGEYTEEQTSSNVQELWKRIYGEWLPMSGYKPLSGPQFEMYGKAESGKSYCEVWIPVGSK